MFLLLLFMIRLRRCRLNLLLMLMPYVYGRYYFVGSHAVSFWDACGEGVMIRLKAYGLFLKSMTISKTTI